MNQRPSVDPAFTFAVALAVSLVMWFPTLQQAMHGDMDITDAGIRYFLALALAWSGVFGICALVAMYAGQPRRQGPPPAARVEQPQRRREDGTPPVEDSNAA